MHKITKKQLEEYEELRHYDFTPRSIYGLQFDSDEEWVSEYEKTMDEIEKKARCIETEPYRCLFCGGTCPSYLEARVGYRTEVKRRGGGTIKCWMNSPSIGNTDDDSFFHWANVIGNGLTAVGCYNGCGEITYFRDYREDFYNDESNAGVPVESDEELVQRLRKFVADMSCGYITPYLDERMDWTLNDWIKESQNFVS